jgi:SAM-dependent methyltransferase
MTEIPEDCIFYHSIDLPGLGTVPGMWDHRGTVDPYLGHVDVADKRVLEVGPASGFFTFELERRGARVMALELGEESDWDRVPQPFADERAQQAALRSGVRSVRNAWSFAHRQLGAKAETVWGSVYEAPQLVGEVDVAMFGNVLQHLRDPVLALTRVGQVTRDTMIVSEAIWNDTQEFRASARMELIARADIPEAWASW